MLREDARQEKEMTNAREVELARTFSVAPHRRFMVISSDGEHLKVSLVPFLALLRKNCLNQNRCR